MTVHKYVFTVHFPTLIGLMHVLNWHINLGEKTGGACILAKKLFSAQVTYLNMKKTIMEVLFKIFQFQIICSFPLNVYAFFFL